MAIFNSLDQGKSSSYISSLDSSIVSTLLLAAALVYVASICSTAWFGLLARLPGPKLARCSNLWRIKNAASSKPHLNFQDLHKQYGRVVRIGPTHVSISDPAQIPVIYGISSKYTKSHFYDTLTPFIDGRPLFSIFSTQDLVAHRTLKSGIAQKYSLSSLLKLEPLVDKVTQNFISNVRTRFDQSTSCSYTNPVFDLGKWVQFYAFDVIGSITFGKTFGFIDAGSDHNGIMEGLESGLNYGAVIGQIPKWHQYLMGNPYLQSAMKSAKFVADSNPVFVAEQMIKDALATKETIPLNDDCEDFATFLKKQNENNPERMSERDMTNHMFVNLLAGSDTTAISLRTIFYLLMMNPDKFIRLRSEIEAAEEAGLLSPVLTYAESQAHIPYLAHVIKECLRLHPAVSLSLERIVPNGGLQIDEQFIPEGTTVGINAWVVHRDKSVFGEDADEFRPERWEAREGDVKAEEKLKMIEKSFFAFGYGARSCIGKNISLMEMSKFVPQFLREFDIEWAGGESWSVHATWFAKQSNVLVKLRSRLQKVAAAK